MAAIRQKPGNDVVGFVLRPIQPRGWCDRSAGSGNSTEIAGGGRKYDHTLRAPRAAGAKRSVAQGDRRPGSGRSAKIDPLELAIGKKSDRPAVGRPERQK